jgi:hypothetical protein
MAVLQKRLLILAVGAVLFFVFCTLIVQLPSTENISWSRLSEFDSVSAGDEQSLPKSDAVVCFALCTN